jgi:hypothetical protein
MIAVVFEEQLPLATRQGRNRFVFLLLLRFLELPFFVTSHLSVN